MVGKLVFDMLLYVTTTSDDPRQDDDDPWGEPALPPIEKLDFVPNPPFIWGSTNRVNEMVNESQWCPTYYD